MTDEATALEAAKKLQSLGARGVIITLGSQGGLILNSDGPDAAYTARKVQAVDATAAGDCFSGALAVALGEGKSLTEAATFAARAAEISVTRLGAQPSVPKRGEVRI